MNTDRFFEICDQDEFVSNAYMGFVIALPRVSVGGRPLNQTTLIGVERGCASYYTPALVAAFVAALVPFSLFGLSRQFMPVVGGLVGSVVGFSLVLDSWLAKIHIRTFPRIHPPKM